MVDSIAVSPDSKQIYYASGHSIWKIPMEDGQPQKVRSGDHVILDPYRQELLVRLNEKEGVRYVRVPLAGGPEVPVPVENGVRLVSGLSAPGPNAVVKDGRIAVQVAIGASWFWPAGLLDPRTGRVQVLQIGYPADMPGPSWTPDGKIVMIAEPLRSSLWKFQPARD